MEYFIKDFYSKGDQVPRKRRIWSHLLEKSLMEIFIYCPQLSKIGRKTWIRKGDQQQYFHSGRETNNENFISKTFEVFLKLQNFLRTQFFISLAAQLVTILEIIKPLLLNSIDKPHIPLSDNKIHHC